MTGRRKRPRRARPNARDLPTPHEFDLEAHPDVILEPEVQGGIPGQGSESDDRIVLLPEDPLDVLVRVSTRPRTIEVESDPRRFGVLERSSMP